MARELMNPCGIVANEDAPLAPRRQIDGKSDAGAPVVIGLFSNQKANADLFMDNMESLLTQRFGNVEIMRGYKAASVPAEFSAEFLERCDVVVAGFGD
ncbi:MAG: hypothetical protein HOA08_22115 [Rhodospirillaceae bacterium]|jgi:hypothetical protein|nr:hypothetical protein [Rhodospirillaceae bacterium]MBT3491714.1 hypothetical protein [Rhodospirillaceae bacterium]MBT3783230.1 hypothetical protein [Rhodospirillaceae bacterium]MBT3978226.1 hypothetical protein [Rhodospirillaceae bacterium]MBT4168961.1 hypothetical protein [Rhodospirillaceae bacterium]